MQTAYLSCGEQKRRDKSGNKMATGGKMVAVGATVGREGAEVVRAGVAGKSSQQYRDGWDVG